MLFHSEFKMIPRRQGGSDGGVFTDTLRKLTTQPTQVALEGDMEYDAAGNRTTMITPDGRTINYVYDFNNLLTRITTNLGAFTFGYDANNRRTSRTLPNGTTATYSYDQGSRLTGIQTTKSGTTIDSVGYTYDNVGNRITKTQPQVNYNYTYDALYRLTQATPTGGTGQPETYTYDQVGNRLTKVPDSSPSANETTLYSYDDENRLTGVQITTNNKTKQLSFTYDPFGRRISKTLLKDDIGTDCTSPNVCPRTTNYVYDNQSIILEYQNGNITARYTHGPGIDEPLAVQQNTNTYFYHADGLGSITSLTDNQGAVIQRYEYDSFGNMTTTGNINQPYTFTAREYDSETGLYFYRARYYDPRAGRFISQDPMGFKGGDYNLFVYVKNNPVTHNDPNGLKVQMCHSPLAGLEKNFMGIIFQHASVSAKCGVYGFHPKNETMGNYLWGPGSVQSDAGRSGLSCLDTMMTIPECVDEDCVCNKISASAKTPPNYSIAIFNCFGWAQQIISQCQK